MTSIRPPKGPILFLSCRDRSVWPSLLHTPEGVIRGLECDGPVISGLPSVFPEGVEGVCHTCSARAALAAYLLPSYRPLVQVGLEWGAGAVSTTLLQMRSWKG